MESNIIDIIRKASREGKVVYGYKKVLKELLHGDLSIVIISSNCPDFIRSDVEYYANLSKIKTYKVSLNNMELGALIGRAHSVSVLGIKE